MKLQTKILFIIFSLALLVGLPLLWTVKEAVQQILLDDVNKRGLLNASDLARSAVTGFGSQSEQILLPLLQAAQERTGAVYAVALSPSGEVVAHTNVVEKGTHYNDPITREGLKTDESLTRILGQKTNAILHVSVPVWRAQKTTGEEEFLLGGAEEASEKIRLGTVRLGLPLREILDIEYRLFRKIAIIVLAAGGIGLSLILFFMRHLLLPIKFLSEGTSRISRGEYGTLVPVKSKDELGDLADSFNRMSKALSETTVSKDFLGSILSQMIDPLIVMNKEGVVQMINQAALDLLQYSETDLKGQSAEVFLPRDHSWMEAVRNLEVEFTTQRGTRIPVLFSSSLLKDHDDKTTGLIAVAKDMTERKRFESAVRQSEKMSAVGQLAAGVAHEINNPLGVILGFAQAVVRRLQPGDALEMPLKSIEKEAVRCKNLVQDLLTFSRVSKIEREPVDINRAVESALSLVIAQARMTHVEVSKELTSDLPRILGNLNQIQQIIINLANNALDAMGDSGRIILKTDSLKEGPLSWVCLRVTDSGPGIPKEIQSRIFEPFFTTKAVGKGTGLGLSLVHEIIKKHSGSIDVLSQPGRTEFCIKFPVRSISSPSKQMVINKET